MNFYLIEQPRGQKYVNFSHLGTWTEGSLCKNCGYPTSKLIEPLICEWEKGWSSIGDFSWCGYTAIVNESVSSYFLNNNFNIRLAKIIVQEQKYKKGSIYEELRQKKYDWLLLDKKIELNEHLSKLEIKNRCNVCGSLLYEYKRESLFIDQQNWHGEKIFYLNQYYSYKSMYLSEDGKTELEKAGFSNITFRQVGNIV